MKKIRMPLEQCSEENILAEDIFNKNGTLVLVKDVRFNGFVIQKLLEIGIEHVTIYQQEEDDRTVLEKKERRMFIQTYHKNVKMIKEVLNDLLKGDAIDIKKVNAISDSIYASTSINEHLVKYLYSLKESDEYTYTHCINVSFYGLLIARWLKLSEMMSKQIVQAGLLHDLGKTKIPSEILNKKDSLSQGEYEEIKKHSLYGYELIQSNTEIAEDVKKAVLMHHEREDKTGYPYGVSGDKINLHGKIIAIADVYDAITTQRVYKKKETPFIAFEVFLTEGIKLFDYHLIKTFVNNMSACFIGTKVRMNNDEEGEIVYLSANDVSNPIVKIGNTCIGLSSKHSLRIEDFI